MKNITVKQLAGTALLAAMIVVLQLVLGSVHVGPFTITFTLVPIIIGAILYGPVSGMVLGAVMGLLVAIASISGQDAAGLLMFEESPVACVVVIFLKSMAAGYIAGRLYQAGAKKNEILGVELAAVAAPVVNTGIFCLAAVTIFHDLVAGWGQAAGFGDLFGYVFVGLIGVNFLIELGMNVVLVPVILRIVRAVKPQEVQP